MFVAEGARTKVIEKRKEQFFEEFVVTMVREAKKLGISAEQLTDMIKRGDNA